MDIRQSDLASYARCPQQKHLKDLAKAGLVKRPSNLSRTVYGTVMHHAVQIMETLHAQGDPNALEVAKSTFAHYWMPENLPELGQLGGHPELVHGIDEWLPRDTYGGMRAKGLQAITDYYELLCSDDGLLLALEINFRVPIDLGPYGQHVLTGTADRVAIRKYLRKPYISVEDLKTGRQPTYLRYSLQWTVYCWASLQPEFWADFPDADERWQLYSGWARRGRWIDLRENKIKDCGWRAEADYARMFVALQEYVRAVEADIYPLSISGETCLWCDFRDGTCGGVPVPEETDGRP